MRNKTSLHPIGTLILVLASTFCAGASDPPLNTRGGKPTEIPTRGNPAWAVQIDYTKRGDVPWDESDFTSLAQDRINRVEINLDWADIEPRKGQYDFHLLDRYLGEVAKARLKLYLIFWESVWREQEGKNPPPWLTAREITSDGRTAQEPPWWDASSRQAYFDYVARTIDHVKANPGFGGLFADYGWLDAMWGPERGAIHGVAGYAPADIEAFHRWLPLTYKTLAAFNQQWNASYNDWTQIPAAKPGDKLFPVYQRFRHYSVLEAYSALSRLVRAHTNAPMFYYWGGGIGGRGGPAVLGNDPDTFFQVAKRYHAVVVEDDADQTGIALLFGSLARAYDVPLLEEWTPRRSGLRAEIPQWLGHIALGPNVEVGEDFFIYPPQSRRPGFVDAFSAYREWHGTLEKLIQGRTADQRSVAVVVPTLKIALSANVEAFADLNGQLTDFWRRSGVLPYFITDQEIARGVVALQHFRAIVDLGDESKNLPALKGYAESHPILKSLDQTRFYLRPYVTIDPSTDSLEVAPVAEGSSVWLTLANCNEQTGLSGTLTFDSEALGLGKALPQVRDARTNASIAATRLSEGRIRWRIDLVPGGFQVVRIRLASAQ